MKTIKQLQEEIKRDGYTDSHSTNIELYKRLYDEAKESLNFIVYAVDCEDIKPEELVTELLHIVNIFSYSTGTDFSRLDFAEDLKAHLFRLSPYHDALLTSWLKDELGERIDEEVAA